MHEIITLQLGQRSNYLATHFWNAQETYFSYSDVSPVDHDISFRPGIGADGSETYTPRTIIYDLKGGFGSLRQYNALYEPQEDAGMPKGLWDGNEVVHRQATITQNEYQKNLELGLPLPKLSPNDVRYWSDFNRLFYHPKSIVQLNEYDLDSKLMPFDDWAVGENLFNTLDREHDLLDRDFRPFAEECDQLQGIQLFTGTDDAWGGFAARYVDRLRDEFGKKNVWTLASENGMRMSRDKQDLKIKNSAKSICEIARESTVYMPITTPPSRLPGYVNLHTPSEWCCSALSSVAVESVTLPLRLRWHAGIRPWQLDNAGPQRIFTLQASIKVGNGSESNFSGRDLNAKPSNQDARQDGQQNGNDEIAPFQQQFDLNFSSIGPTLERDEDIFSRIQVVRDVRLDKSGFEGTEVGQNLKAQQLTSWYGDSRRTVSIFRSTLEFPIAASFPSDLIRGQSAGSPLGVDAAMSATSEVGKHIKQLQHTIGRRVAVEEREDLVNGLGEICEAYQARWEGDSDSGDE